MIEPDRLPLHEEVMLLALRDREGTIAFGSMYRYALAGAILSELMMRGRIGVVDVAKRKLARVLDERKTGVPLLDECLEKITRSSTPRDLQHWVSEFAGIRNLKHRVAERLCDRGVVREEEGKILLVFSRRIYPETDPRPEDEIVDRLRDAIFTGQREVEPRTVVLVSLASKTGLLEQVFDKRELRRRKERIEQVVDGELLGRAAEQVIHAVQTAAMVAAIMPAVISTSS